MQSFQKKLLKKSSLRKKQQNLDDYQKAVQSTSNKVVQIQKQTMTELSTTNQMINYFGRSYTIIFTAIISSAFIYPLSIRFVKKVFGLKQFFNVHFAIVPIIANWNALVLGVVQGYINYSFVAKNYPNKQDQQLNKIDNLL